MAKSIITKFDDISAFSGKPAECSHHCVFGVGLRKLADQDGLILPLTHEEHNLGRISERIHGNSAAESLSRMVGQLAWEKHWLADIIREVDPDIGDVEDDAREAFRDRYSISYL